MQAPSEIVFRPSSGADKLSKPVPSSSSDTETNASQDDHHTTNPTALTPKPHILCNTGLTSNTSSIPHITEECVRKACTKGSPICKIPSIYKENMPVEKLLKFCHNPLDVFSTSYGDMDTDNCSSSSCAIEVNRKLDSNADDTRDLGRLTILKDDRQEHMDEGLKEDDHANNNNKPPGNYTMIMRNNSIIEWEKLKKSILKNTESRNGRDLQRFTTDLENRHLLRLTTGCVPIMKDGKIMIVSSGRKENWILPKGGWEQDESAEASALRESYEEGGILGTLGPRLTPIDYETRKAKKQRLELEESAHGSSGISTESHGAPPSSAVSVHSTSSLSHAEENEIIQSNFLNRCTKGLHSSGDALSPSTITSKGSLTQQDRQDDTASFGSVPLISSDPRPFKCSHVRLTMFPLYVLEVRENWPESGRARKVVDIDTAIETMSARPEFQRVLLEVKEKGYHLNPHFNMSSNSEGIRVIGSDR